MEQYRATRSEIVERMKLDQQIQRNAVILIVAFYTLILGADGALQPPWPVFLLPSAIAGVTYVQQRRFKVWAMRMGRYVLQLEAELPRPMEPASLRRLGWEHFVAEEREGEHRQVSDLFDVFRSPEGGGRHALSTSFIDSVTWIFFAVLFLVVALIVALL